MKIWTGRNDDEGEEKGTRDELRRDAVWLALALARVSKDINQD